MHFHGSTVLVSIFFCRLLTVGAATNLDGDGRTDGSSYCYERPMNPIAFLCNTTASDCLAAFDGRPETFSSGPILMVIDLNMRDQASRSPDAVDLAGRITTVGKYSLRTARRSRR
jgi:hypothetical protein